MSAINYHYRGRIERGNGKPGYNWHPGYSETTADGGECSPWMTRRECLADARTRGAKAVFFISDKSVESETI